MDIKTTNETVLSDKVYTEFEEVLITCALAAGYTEDQARDLIDGDAR